MDEFLDHAGSMLQSQSEDAWKSFLRLCLQIQDEKLLNDFFQLFFTHEERDALTTRFLIIRELLRGKMTQREMAEQLKVSIAKITRGSNAMKSIDASLEQFLENFFK